MTMVGEIIHSKIFRRYMSDRNVALRLKDIRHVIRRDNCTYEQAVAMCLDTVPGTIYQERQNGSQPVVQKEFLSIV